MPHFRYRGLDTEGKSVAGTLTAEDERLAIAQLKTRGVFPSELREANGGRAAASIAVAAPPTAAPARTTINSGIITDLTVLTRQLSNLISGGIALIPAFAALTEHTENARLRVALTNMQQEVRGGKALWETLALYPHIFPSLYVSMVKAGEASGQLAAVLAWLADYLESEQARRTQIRGALVYPTLLVSFSVVAIALLLTLVVPKFTGIFEEFDQALPLPTVVLLQISDFFVQWGLATLGALAVLVFLIRRYARTAGGRFRIDAWKLRMPLYRRVGFRAAISRFARTMATLLRGGVPLLDALSVARDVLDNAVLARATEQVQEGMREGGHFGERLKETGVFPPLLSHMVSIGEETGDLHGVLLTVANTYDVEVEATLKGLVAALEPAIIITLGSLIAFIILAMLLPVFQINLVGG